MDILLNLVAGTIFLAVLGLCLFLLLPLASMAGDSPQAPRGLTYAFLLLLGFIPFWLIKGFSFTRSLVTGDVFHADYWVGTWNFSLTIAGIGSSLWIAIAWFLYLLGLILFGILTFFALVGLKDASSNPTRILALSVFGVIAYLGYLWGDSGKEWLISWFA